MPTFSMSELLKNFGNSVESTETVSQPSHDKSAGGRRKAVGERPYQEHRSRQDTETLIKNMLQEAGKPMTIVAISRKLDRTPSPHFRSLIASMVAAGDLVETVDTAPNGRMVRYWYSLP